MNEPLAPGAKLEIRWDLSWRNPGFTNSKSTTRVVENGTFVDNRDIMPTIGYDPGLELTDNNKRRKHGLPPVERLPKYDERRRRRARISSVCARARPFTRS